MASVITIALPECTRAEISFFLERSSFCSFFNRTPRPAQKIPKIRKKKSTKFEGGGTVLERSTARVEQQQGDGSAEVPVNSRQ